MSDRFGKPTISERERQEAIRRAQKKRVPKTRFIANSVPASVLRWLVANEEAVLSGAATPSMPRDVAEWIADRVDNFAGGPRAEAVASEKVEEAVQPTPSQLSHTCAICGAPFAAKRSDAKFCSTRCQVAAHRRAA